MDKTKTYFENALTHEMTDDKWQADTWSYAGADVVIWAWCETFDCWLDWMVREGYHGN